MRFLTITRLDGVPGCMGYRSFPNSQSTDMSSPLTLEELLAAKLITFAMPLSLRMERFRIFASPIRMVEFIVLFSSGNPVPLL